VASSSISDARMNTTHSTKHGMPSLIN